MIFVKEYQSYNYHFELNEILSLFSCNRVMCLHKGQTYVPNYCTFKLSTDTEKKLIHVDANNS